MTPWVPHLLALLVAGPALADRWLFSPRGIGRAGAYARIAAWQVLASVLILLGAGPAAVWTAPATWSQPAATRLAALAAAIFVAGVVFRALRPAPSGGGRDSGFWPRTRRQRAGWILVAVTSGIGEEIMFRGYLLRYFHVFPWQLDMKVAIAASCLLFGAGHLYQGAFAGLRAAAAGLFFFGLFLASGSLLLPALTHLAVDLAGSLPAVLRRRSQRQV